MTLWPLCNFESRDPPLQNGSGLAPTVLKHRDCLALLVCHCPERIKAALRRPSHAPQPPARHSVSITFISNAQLAVGCVALGYMLIFCPILGYGLYGPESIRGVNSLRNLAGHRAPQSVL